MSSVIVLVGVPYNNLYEEVPQQGTSFNSGQTIPRSFLFVNFWYREVKQLAPLKKKALKLVKFPSFESDLLKSDEDISPQSRAKFYRSRPFVWLVPDTKSIEIEFTYIQSC